MKDREREFAQDDFVYNVTEDILVMMEDLNISKQELARRMGKSKALISQLLDGSRNMTLRTLSDVCFALGIKAKFNILNQDISFNEEILTDKELSKGFEVSIKVSKQKEISQKEFDSDASTEWYSAAG